MPSQNVQNDLEGQVQWSPFSIPDESIPGCMFGANLVILAKICDELSHGQAKFPRILSQNGQNDLDGQGQWPPFALPNESIPGCMFGANLVILAQICDYRYRADKPNFLEFWVKMAKMTLKVKVNDLHFYRKNITTGDSAVQMSPTGTQRRLFCPSLKLLHWVVITRNYSPHYKAKEATHDFIRTHPGAHFTKKRPS